jgi:hypothetical protein
MEHYVIRDAPPIFMKIGNLVYFRALGCWLGISQSFLWQKPIWHPFGQKTVGGCLGILVFSDALGLLGIRSIQFTVQRKWLKLL